MQLINTERRNVKHVLQKYNNGNENLKNFSKKIQQIVLFSHQLGTG